MNQISTQSKIIQIDSDLIDDETGEVIQTVSGRNLHASLKAGKDFSSWVKAQIDRCRFVDGKDYLAMEVSPQKGENSSGGRPRTEYHFTLDSAKHISMMSGTDKGFEVRDYFIACERRVINSTPAFSIPTTLSAALRLAADQSDQIEAQQAQLAIAAPKVAALARIEAADGMLNLQAAGKALQQKPNKFTQWMRENNWIYKRQGSSSNCARAEKFNAGYLTTKAHTVIQPDGTERVREQCMVTGKGLVKLALIFGVTLNSGLAGV